MKETTRTGPSGVPPRPSASGVAAPPIMCSPPTGLPLPVSTSEVALHEQNANDVYKF
jgi:hypothetical protein